MKKILLYLGLGVAVLLTACAAKPWKLDVEKVISLVNKGNMDILSVKPYAEGQEGTKISETGDNSMINTSISFTGLRAIVSGTYTIYGKEDEFYPNKACFRLYDDASSKSGLPTIKGDTRKPGFCFSNTEKAKELLRPSSGDATIVVENYVLNLFGGEVYDTADLYEVESQRQSIKID